MLIKAARTKELSSYSRGNLVLANVGNAVHSIYVVQLPAGPIWALHTFYVVTSGLMLVWHLRYANASPRSDGVPSLPEILMTIEHIETAIIGAGQAGLATAYHLQRRGRPCLILDGNERVGDNWRAQWDSLRLYTPARYDGLPGCPSPVRGGPIPTKDEVADYLAAYADTVRAAGADAHPSRPACRRSMGGTCSSSELTASSADNVVVATGTFGRTPQHSRLRVGSRPVDPAAALQRVPQACAAQAWSGARRRRRPTPAPTSPTRWQPPTRRCWPARPRSGAGTAGPLERSRLVLPVIGFLAKHVLTRRTPIGRKAMDEVRFHGGPMLRVKRSDLQASWCGADPGPGDRRSATGDRAGRRRGALDVANVVWCTGFRQVFDWIDLPIFGADGWPREMRGVVPEAPGLFFCGLAFQYAFSSTVLPGVGRDAAYVAEQIKARVGRSFALAA